MLEYVTKQEVSPHQEFSVCGCDFNEELLNRKQAGTYIHYHFLLSSPCDTRNLDLCHKHKYVVIYSIEG